MVGLAIALEAALAVSNKNQGIFIFLVLLDYIDASIRLLCSAEKRLFVCLRSIPHST
jgi:hypothetical protein